MSFYILAQWNKSRDVHPCDMVPRCPVSRCQSPQFWCSRDVRSRVFCRRLGGGGSKIALSHWLGPWLIQQLVLPYKSWWSHLWRLYAYASMCARNFNLLFPYYLTHSVGTDQIPRQPAMHCNSKRAVYSGAHYWAVIVLVPGPKHIVSASYEQHCTVFNICLFLTICFLTRIVCKSASSSSRATRCSET